VPFFNNDWYDLQLEILKMCTKNTEICYKRNIFSLFFSSRGPRNLYVIYRHH